MKDFTSQISSILQTIHSKSSFVLTSHVNPDGDGLGSELAMYYYLKSLKKSVRIINASPLPATFRFMDPGERIFELYTDHHEEDIIGCDAVFILDISDKARLGEVGSAIEKSKSTRICIDHHASNNFPADLVFADEKAAATGELLIRLFKKDGFSMTVEIAEALYIALMSDTGCFRFSNTNGIVHELTAELFQIGIDHQKIYHYIYENNSWEKTRLYSMALTSLKKEGNGSIAVMDISRNTLNGSGASYEDIEGFTEFGRSICEVLISILFVEMGDSEVKVSFRSSKGVRVNELAAEFGGGGHKNASAATLYDISLEDAKKKVLAVAQNYVR